MSEVSWVRSTLADLRAEPSRRAERVSQLLLFSPGEVLAGQDGWRHLRGPDGYSGWAMASLLTPGPPPTPRWKVARPSVTVRSLTSPRPVGRMALDTRVGGHLEGGRLRLPWPGGGEAWIAAHEVVPIDWRGGVSDLLQLAGELVGVPYLWGGTSPFGFDCSGFIQRLFHFVFDRWLPRDTCQQRLLGQPIESIDQLLPGDLLFFPGHVGLWAGEGVLIHASGSAGMVVRTFLSPPRGTQAIRLAATFQGGRRLTAGGPPT
ncbi:MAG: NlpC/P60 family protein [Candidatus Bipolaricaulaceae bacterium]